MQRREVFENEAFELDESGRKLLRRLLGGNLVVSEGRATVLRMVGSVALPDGTMLVIRSRKSDAASLLAWMTYADPALLALRHIGAFPKSLTDGELGPLVARLFCEQVLLASRQHGVLRNYRRTEARTSRIQGRIDFPRLARAGGDVSRTPCVVWERLPRTPLNCLLAEAADRVRRNQSLRPAAGRALSEVRALLSDVPGEIDAALLLGRRPLTRLEQPYEIACALARLILRSTGLSEGAQLDGASFLVNLEALFEQAVARAFLESPLLSVPGAPLKYRRLAEADGARRAGSGSMTMDVFLPNVAGRPVVVDAKYKTAVSAANLQQMVTYCWMTGARRAVLVFPEGQVQDRRPFVLRGAKAEEEIRVDVVELRTAGQTLSEWHESGRELVADVVALVGTSTGGRSSPMGSPR